MPSPLRSEHGDHDGAVSYWVLHYKRFTKGLRSGKNSTVILDPSGETQPDAFCGFRRALGRMSIGLTLALTARSTRSKAHRSPT